MATSPASTSREHLSLTRFSKIWRIGTSVFFFVYVAALMVAGTTSRSDPNSLKKSLEVLQGVHVACGLFGVYFPPLFIVFTLYQLLDKYGLLTHGPQTWQSSLVDYGEFFVGAGIVYVGRAMRPCAFYGAGGVGERQERVLASGQST